MRKVHEKLKKNSRQGFANDLPKKKLFWEHVDRKSNPHFSVKR